MRNIHIVVLAFLCIAPLGAARIPDGGLNAHIQIFFSDAKLKGREKELLSCSRATPDKKFIDLVSRQASGILELNYRNLPVESGEKVYAFVKFDVKSFGARAGISLRLTFFNQEGKFLVNHFCPRQEISERGMQEFLWNTVVPKEAAKAALTVWFGGEVEVAISEAAFEDKVPEVKNPDGNLMRNGSFESPSMYEYHIRHIVDGKEVKPNPEIRAFRDGAKVKSGRFALFGESKLEKSTIEINLNMLPFKSGMRYRLGAEYFLVSINPKARVAGRVTFWGADGKVIGYLFPEWKKETGVWNSINLSFQVPAKAVRTTMTLWFSGGMKFYLDDVYYGEDPEKTLENRSSGAVLLRRGDGFTLWKEAPYLKVPKSGVPEGIAQGAVEFSAAANEREPFQLVLSPERKMSGVTPIFSELKSQDGKTIPASAFGFKPVGFIQLKNPDNPKMAGWNADPLLPERSIEVEGGTNGVFYVYVDVPAGTPAGNYSGSVRLAAAGKIVAEIPLKLQVRGFSLPDIPRFKSYFYSQPHKAYLALDQRSWKDVADNMQLLLKEHRMSGNQAQWPPIPKFEIQDGKLTVTDWSVFDERIREWRDKYHLRHFGVPGFGMMGDNDGWFGPGRKLGKSRLKLDWFKPEEAALIGQYAKAFTEHVKKTFPELDFYAYLYDEPPVKVQAELKKITDLLHAAAPELKIFIVKNVTPDIGYVHTWVVPFGPGYIKPELQKEELKKGHDIWYYNWPVRLGDFEYIRNRLFSWQVYALEGSGGLLWNTVWTPAGVNPWNDMDKTPGCGSATIFYPPRRKGEGMVASLRAAQIRECIDDFDYLKILEERIDRLYPGKGRVRVLELLRSIIPDGAFEFRNDPHLLYSLRDRVADEIERYAPGSSAPLLLSTPSEHCETELSSVSLECFGKPGTVLRIEGKTLTIPASGKLEYALVLPKIGPNAVIFSAVSPEGKKFDFRRSWERLRDPRLAQLEKMTAQASVSAELRSQVGAFLKKVSSGVYGEAERSEAGKLVAAIRRGAVAKALAQPVAAGNLLASAFFREARTMFDAGLFDRAEYYLELYRRSLESGSREKAAVRLHPAEINGHFGVRMENGKISATVLETGGRIISFKVDGVETLRAGDFSHALSRLDRARGKADRSMSQKLHGIGGYEDAGAGGLWPDSWNDWNFSLPVVRDDKVVLRAETAIAGTPFLLRRDMTMSAGSPDLIVECELRNATSEELRSDDPEHFQIAWRGRFVPAVGPDGTAGDQLIVPLKQNPAETRMDGKKCFYEIRSEKLAAPFAGSFDPASKTGLMLLPDKNLTHLYVWFDNRTDNGVYTIEFPRSFYGKRFDDPEANRPFEIKPGRSQSFGFVMRGVSGVSGEKEFRSAVKGDR